jgi:hypothetical protein
MDDAASRLRNQKVEVTDAALPEPGVTFKLGMVIRRSKRNKIRHPFYRLSSSSSGGSDCRQVATKRVI